MNPDFWDDPEAARRTQLAISRLQYPIEGWQSCSSTMEDAEILLELAMDEHDEETEKESSRIISRLEDRLENFEIECMFSGEHDANNAMLAIHAGAGGTEAQDWVDMLLRMYLRWAEEKGFSSKILDIQPGDEAGVKSATIMVNGRYAYGYLRSEMASTGWSAFPPLMSTVGGTPRLPRFSSFLSLTTISMSTSTKRICA